MGSASVCLFTFFGAPMWRILVDALAGACDTQGDGASDPFVYMLFDFADHELCTPIKGQCRAIRIKPCA